MTNKEAIRRIKEHMIVHKMNEPHAILITEALNMAIKALEEQASSSEKPNKWIPVSEATPIIGQDVLVCDVDGDMYITYLHTDGGWGFNYTCTRIKNVVAWQELPLPYKAGSEDTDD